MNMQMVYGDLQAAEKGGVCAGHKIEHTFARGGKSLSKFSRYSYLSGKSIRK